MNPARFSCTFLFVSLLAMLTSSALNAQSQAQRRERGTTAVTNLSDVTNPDELSEYLRTNLSDILVLVCGADLSGCSETDCHEVTPTDNPIVIVSLDGEQTRRLVNRQSRYFPVCTVKFPITGSLKYSWGSNGSIEITKNADGSWTVKGTYKGVQGSATTIPKKKEDQKKDDPASSQEPTTPTTPSSPPPPAPGDGTIEISRAPQSETGAGMRSEGGSTATSSPHADPPGAPTSVHVDGVGIAEAVEDLELRLIAGEPFALTLEVSEIPGGERLVRRISREMEHIAVNRSRIFVGGRFHPETYNQLTHSVSEVRKDLTQVIAMWPRTSENSITEIQSESLRSLAVLVQMVEQMSWELESIGDAVRRSRH